jgi:uncharacterized protein
MRSSSYIVAIPLPGTELTLLFHGYSGAVDLVTSRIANLLTKPASSIGRVARALPQTTLTHLLARGYLTEKTPEAEQSYVIELGRRVHAVMRKHASPGFLVVPTYACNLRCTYCYERDLQQKGPSWLEKRMSAEMIEAALEAMDKIDRSSRRPRCLTFYGGEPLQRSNESTIRLLFEQSCKRGFQRFSAITNAVDLHHFKDMLGQENRISFLQITVDGPPPIHDKRRCLPDGTGTFRRVTENIELAMKQGTRVSVRINVDRGNASQVEWLQGFFRDKGWTQNALFRAYCSPVHGRTCGKRGPNDFASHLEMQRAIRDKDDREEAREEPTTFQTDALTYAVQKRILAHLSQKEDLPFWKTAFCGSNMAMYLFDPFGNIYPCWEVIGHPEHRIGVYGPGSLELDARALEQWHHRSVVRISSCRSCPYLFFCGGGCEAFAYRATGRLDQPHCFDFPKHFEKAAVLAYRQWNAHRQQKNPLQ